MFACHNIKVMEVLYRENNHHANTQSEKPTKNMSPTIPLPRSLPVNLPASFTLSSVLMFQGFCIWTQSLLLPFAAIFSVHSPLDEKCTAIGVCRTASHIPGSCPQIYSFTLNSCIQRPSCLWHLVMILTRYFISGYCMASPWTSISCDISFK